MRVLSSLRPLALLCVAAGCGDQTTVAPQPMPPVAARVVTLAYVDGHTPPGGVTCQPQAGTLGSRIYTSEIRFVGGELVLRHDSTFQWTYTIDRTYRTVAEPAFPSHGAVAYRQEGFFRVRGDALLLTYVSDGSAGRPTDEYTLSDGRVVDGGFELTYFVLGCPLSTGGSPFRKLTLGLRG